MSNRDRRFQQAAELAGVLLFVALFGLAFLVAVVVGAVGGRTDRSTEGTPRIGVPSIVLPARTPVPPAVGMGDGGQPIQAPAPVVSIVPNPATAIQSAVTEVSATPISQNGPLVKQAAPPTSAVVAPVSTVIVSAMTPTARATSEVSSPVQTGTLEAQVRAAVERYFPASEWATAMRIASCESHFEPWAAEPGGNHFGVLQVDPSLHGAVPPDIDGQVRQGAEVWAKVDASGHRLGWSQWSCR